MNLSIREQYHSCLREYKFLLSHKKDIFQLQILKKLEKENNSKEFWKILRSAKNSFDNVEVPPISETEWLNHFQSLHADNNENDDWLKEDLKRPEQKSSVNNNLDYPISDQELFSRMQTLKNKKACGVDKISNEMIKSSIYLLSTVYRKLFNIVLNSGNFPESWSLSIITPIFKAGVRNDPGNYRGTCVSSCLGKFFCSILNERLINYYDKNNIIHQSQIGFRPGFRTSDHIFTLRTLVDRYVNTVKQGKIYACFVVFKKLLTVFGTMGYYISCCPLESGVISLML